MTITLPLPGAMFLSNALAAAAVGHALNLSLENMKQGLEQFQPMPGRMERIISMHGATIINDAYNANPVSLESSLRVLRQCRMATEKSQCSVTCLSLVNRLRLYHWQAGHCDRNSWGLIIYFSAGVLPKRLQNEPAQAH